MQQQQVTRPQTVYKAEAEPGNPTVRDVTTCNSLSGSWLCTKVVGDADSFLEDMGVSDFVRMVASSFKYGVGQFRQIIVHDGDRIEVPFSPS